MATPGSRRSGSVAEVERSGADSPLRCLCRPHDLMESVSRVTSPWRFCHSLFHCVGTRPVLHSGGPADRSYSYSSSSSVSEGTEEPQPLLAEAQELLSAFAPLDSMLAVHPSAYPLE